MSDKLIRANRWKAAYNDEGGIKDIFDKIREAYFRRAGKLDVTLSPELRMAALERLSFASNVLDMVEDHIRAYVDDGKLEEANALSAEKIEGLPPQRRKWASFL